MRAAVIGCGAVAEHYHLPALLSSADVRLVAFADPRLDRARRLAALARAGTACTSHIEIINHVDLAIVCVPHAQHEAVATELLDAGVHVLVEKPMARTSAECDRMMAAAAKSGAILAVGHDFRHFPLARFTRQFVASGPLGPIRHVDVRQNAGHRWPSVSSDVLSRDAGGGVMLTFGVHIVDLLCWWFGDMQVVAYRDDSAGGVEADAESDFVLTSGATVHFELSRLRAMRDTFVVECENGSIEIGIHEPAVLRISPTTSPTLHGSIRDGDFEAAPIRTVFARQLADVVRAVQLGRAPLVGGEEGRRAVALVDACYAARQPLRRPWDFPEAFAFTTGGGEG